jgi:hypothetical protein
LEKVITYPRESLMELKSLDYVAMSIIAACQLLDETVGGRSTLAQTAARNPDHSDALGVAAAMGTWHRVLSAPVDTLTWAARGLRASAANINARPVVAGESKLGRMGHGFAVTEPAVTRC